MKMEEIEELLAQMTIGEKQELYLFLTQMC